MSFSPCFSIDRYPETWSIQYNNHQYQWYSRWFKLKYPPSNSTMYPPSSLLHHSSLQLQPAARESEIGPSARGAAGLGNQSHLSSDHCPPWHFIQLYQPHWSCCAMQSWDKPCHLHYWSLYKYDINTSAFTGRCLYAVLWLLAGASDHLWCVAAGILDPVLDMWKWSGCCKLAYLLSINCS